MDRFWDMFVTDVLVGNEDWGFLTDGDDLALVPVYDDGNSFLNKRGKEQVRTQLARDPDPSRDAIGGVRSCFVRDGGHPISPMATSATQRTRTATLLSSAASSGWTCPRSTASSTPSRTRPSASWSCRSCHV